MSTTFPDSIQNFPTMEDITLNDVTNVKNYQTAILNGNFTLASQYLGQITNSNKKLLTAEFLNTIKDTIVALQNYYLEKWSPAYVVSSSQPSNQETGDFWIQVIS